MPVSGKSGVQHPVGIPDGGVTGEVLQKVSGQDFEADWGAGGGGGAAVGSDFLVWSDESATLPNSRNLVAGTGVTFDDSVANVRTINASASGGGVTQEQLTAAMGVALAFEGGGGGDDGSPGPRGSDGAAGSPGSQGDAGAALFMLAEDGESGDVGPPGRDGTNGTNGTNGAPGAAGPAIFMLAEDGVEGDAGPPGVGTAGAAGAPGAQGAQGAALFMLAEDGVEGDMGPPGATGAQGQAGVGGGGGSILMLDLSSDYSDDGERGPPGATGPQGAPGGGGGGSATVVEVNVGSTPRHAGRFTITDAGIGASSKIFIQHAPGPYTGKGTRADEADMDPLWCVAYPNGAGQAIAHWRTLQGMTPRHKPNTDPRALTTVLTTGSSADRAYGRADAPMHVVGRIKGNVKFQYMVLA